jgi:hypothetical protein
MLNKLLKLNWWRYIPLLAMAAVLFGMSSKTPMVIDEYEFYRLSSEIPNYSSTANWFIVDRPSTIADIVLPNEQEAKALQVVYDTPIYSHSPLVPILVSPIVKGLNFLADKGIIPHIEAQKGETKGEIVPAETMTQILRIIPIGLFILTLYLIFKIMEKKVGNHAYLMWIPVFAGIGIWQGAMLFYWDDFMMFFLVLTLYLQEMHPNSKWKYVTACCLVNTKMWIGLAFLLPIVILEFRRNWKTCWKMMLPALSIIPWWIITSEVTHQPLYLWTHYWNQMYLHNSIDVINSFSNYFNIFMLQSMPLYVAIFIMLLLKFPKHLEYAVFLLMAMAYEWGNTLSTTYLPSILCSAALAMPLVSYEWNLIERSKKWFGLSEKVQT